MSFTLEGILARSNQLCVGRGVNPLDSPLLDAGLTLETLYPHALRYVVARDLENGGSPLDYMRKHTLTIATGFATLPDAVLRRFLDLSFIETEGYASFVSYPDYLRSRYDALLKYYAIDENRFYYSGADGNIVLVTPSLPDVPTLSTDVITGLSAKQGEDVILAMAGAVTGELRLHDLLSYQ